MGRPRLFTTSLTASALFLLGTGFWLQTHAGPLVPTSPYGRQVHAGVPYIEQDAYSTNVCVSNRSGLILPPFVSAGTGR
jgi:hypothetical protein